MNLLVSVSAPDDDTFVIEMSEPYYPMLTELACIRPFAMISPNCMIDGSTKDGVNGYIGTGPYVLTDFVTDEYAVFERNENYWGEKPTIRRSLSKLSLITRPVSCAGERRDRSDLRQEYAGRRCHQPVCGQ